MRPVIVALLLLAAACQSASSAGGRFLFNAEADGVALGGHDPVSYFPEGGGAPLRGRPELAVTHEGVTWRFAREAHRELFRADPDRYTPAYGGWCAWAMARNGELVGIDPRSYLIEDGRLLLFYDGLFADTRARWRAASSTALRAEADRHWDARRREASAAR